MTSDAIALNIILRAEFYVNIFCPKFIDLITVFKPLSFEELAKITNLMIRSLNKKLEEKNITLKLTESALMYLIDAGYNSEYGARPLKRLIEQKIEDVIAGDLLEGKLKENYLIVASYKDNQMQFAYSKKDN